MNNKKIYLKILLTLILFLGLGKKLYANTLEFQILPAIIEIESKPGEIIQKEIVIRGSGGQLYTLGKYGLDILDNHGHFTSSNVESDHLEWISFDSKGVSFDSVQEQKVKLQISIPIDAGLGDYYSTIALEKSAEEGNEDGGNRVGGALEIPLLISITDNGQPALQGEIKNFEGPKVQLFNPTRFFLEVENSGFRRLKSFGKIEITNLITRKTESKELVPKNILANSSRTVVDEEGFLGGREYISWDSPSYFGIYSAKVSIYDKYFVEEDAKLIDTSSNIYFVFFHIYLVLGLTLFLLIILFIKVNKRYKGALTGKQN